MINRYCLIGIVCLATASPCAQAELSGNLGFMSDYIFRGIPQAPTSAMGGLDYEQNGFYVGTWAADVDLGAEVDVYLGYSGSVEDFSYSVGSTGYFYTDDFDDTYREINLNVGYQLVSLEYSFGEYDNFTGPTLDYAFTKLSAELGDFFAAIGSFSKDANGDYYELGYGKEIEGFDLSISAVHSNRDLIGDSETNLVFTISRAFQLGSQ